MLNFIKKYKARLAREKIRALRQIKEREGEKHIFKFINDISEKNLFGPQKDEFFRRVRKLTSKDLDLSLTLNQILVDMFCREISSLLMLSRYGSKMKVFCALPGVYRKELVATGLRISRFSSLLWVLFLGKLFYRNIRGFIYLLIKYSSRVNLGGSTIILGASKSMYASVKNKETGGKNFLQWFSDVFPGKNYLLVDSEQHSRVENLEFIERPYIPIEKWDDKVRFFFRGFKTLTYVLLKSFMGHWYHMILLEDLIAWDYVSLSLDKQVPERVIFTNTFFIHRPIWTYLYEAKNTHVGMLFYGINNQDFVYKDKSSTGLHPGYSIMSWKNYYTMDSYHADSIKKCTKRFCTNIKVMDELLPTGNKNLVEQTASPPIISFFPVVPFKDSYMARIGRPCDLYTYEISNKLLSIFEDIYNNYNCRILMKFKRNTKNGICPKFRSRVADLVKAGVLELVDPEFSVESIVKQSIAVVCQPFTTAALFAKKESIPVAFADPTDMLFSTQPASCGIDIVHGYSALYNWLEDKICNFNHEEVSNG